MKVNPGMNNREERTKAQKTQAKRRAERQTERRRGTAILEALSHVTLLWMNEGEDALAA